MIFILLPPAPNPANPMTTILFRVDRAQRVQVSVLDLRGRRVAQLEDRLREAGRWSVVWDGRDANGHEAPSGTYIVRLRGQSREMSRKVSLVR